MERDQLIQQLEKSQDMLMNFQQELNATEQELQRQREENKRLQKSPNQHPNTLETQRLQAEIHALEQRSQEPGARGDNELEQWRKVVEQEKNRADQAEKEANEMHKHVQALHSDCKLTVRSSFQSVEQDTVNIRNFPICCNVND